MSTNSGDRQTLIEMVKAVGAILGTALAMFTFVNSAVGQPVTALVVALIAAVLVSIWVVRSHWTGITQVIVTWLALIVVVLAGFVFWPRTITVEGFIHDTVGNSIGNDEVVFFDHSGKRYEAKTDAKGHYQFIEVPIGKYRVQARGNEVAVEVEAILVRTVQLNFVVGTSVAVLPTPTPTDTSSPTPRPSPTLANTPTPTATNTPLPSPSDTPTTTPASTPTPSPTFTPTATPILTTCGPVTNPKCLVYVSSQLAKIRPAAPFFFPIDQAARFTAEYTEEESHSEPISIKLVYNSAPSSFGGWGIGSLGGYNASQFTRVSFYLKGTVLGQMFELKLKDTAGREDPVPVTVDTLNWKEISFPLDRNTFPNVDFASLDNLNLGFNDSLGSATIYADDFEFLP